MFDIKVSKIHANNLSNYINKKQQQFRTDYNLNAFYYGTVEDTNDPLNMGRIKVRIPGLHGTSDGKGNYLSTRDIPWAYPGLLNGGTNDMGQYIVPIKGSMVNVSFQYNDFNKPVYFGSTPTKYKNTKLYNDNANIYGGKSVDIQDDDDIKDLSSNSAKTVIYKSLKGSTVLIDDTDGKESLQLIDATGQVFEMGNSSGSALTRRGSKLKPSKSSSPYMSLRNNLGDEISIVGGEIKIVTSNGEEIVLSEGKVNLLVGDTEFSLEEGKANVTVGSASIDLEEGKVNFTDGESSISLDGGTCTFNTTNFVLNATNTNINDYVTK